MQKSLAAIPGIENYVLTINSFSKTFAMTGFRVGYIRKRKDNRKPYKAPRKYDTEPTQFAAAEAIYNEEKDVRKMVKYYDRNRKLLVDSLNKMNSFPLQLLLVTKPGNHILLKEKSPQ